MADSKLLLSYAYETNPLQLLVGSSASLIIVVSNPNADAVELRGLIIRLPIGKTSTDLTETAAEVTCPDGWKQSGTTQASGGKASYVMVPTDGEFTVGAAGLTFSFQNIQVNGQVGTCEVEVVEGSNDCDSDSDCPTDTLKISKGPQAWGDVEFWATPANVNPNEAVYLHWRGPQGATYKIEYVDAQENIVKIPAVNAPPLGSGQYPSSTNDKGIELVKDTEFTLSVLYQGLSAQKQAKVTVVSKNLAIVSFSADPDYASPGDIVKLSWKTQWATSWLIIPGEIQVPVTERNDSGDQVGNYTVTPTVDTTYTLKATDGDKNTRSENAPVKLDPNIITGEKALIFTGEPGADGSDGRDGDPGPTLTLSVQKFAGWLLEVEVESSADAPKFLIAPSGVLTIVSKGGKGSEGRLGGVGGAGGPGGTVTVNCPAELVEPAKKSLVVKSEGGDGASGSEWGASKPGKSGTAGSVTWNKM